MSTGLEHGALRRKIAAHARALPPTPDLSDAGGRVFGRALRRASGPFEGLGLTLGEITLTAAQTLEMAIAALPEHGLAAALEDAGGRRGLVGLSSGLIDALIEVQTTGRVEAAELPPRPVTRIDETMVRDFIDLTLSAFTLETAEVVARTWPDQMAYGSRIQDRGRLTLLMPEMDYVVFAADVGFDGVGRRARIILVLPEHRAARPKGGAAPAKPADPEWIAARERILDKISLPFEVVLMRVVRPLSEVERLAEGDLLPFSPADLQQLALEDSAGQAILHGRLGQLGGRRALRLAGDASPPMPDMADHPSVSAGGGGAMMTGAEHGSGPGSAMDFGPQDLPGEPPQTMPMAFDPPVGAPMDLSDFPEHSVAS